MFIDLLKGADAIDQYTQKVPNEVLDLKIFKLMKDVKDDISEQLSTQNRNNFDNAIEEYSLKDILTVKQSLISEQMFQITQKNNTSGKFRYVHIKKKQMGSDGSTNSNKEVSGLSNIVDNILLQIIDVSDKMLYNKVKAK